MFRCGLKFDKAKRIGHNDVGVDFGARIFLVAKVEDRLAVEDADTNRGYGSNERSLRQHLVLQHLPDGESQRNVRASDRGDARAAIRLQYIAVDDDRAFAEKLEVDGSAQRASDEALNLVRASAGTAFRQRF